MANIAIITICFNNLNDLIKTCASVDFQKTKPFVHWIINGSSDNSISDWLSNNLQPGYRKWINERDKGIADAFNKGIKNAHGDIIHILNSGDIYAFDDILTIVEETFKHDTGIEWISGKIKTNRSGQWIVIGKRFDKKQLYKGMRSVSHPTWFLKKELYHKYGAFSEKYKIAMDYDLMCRISGEPYQFVNKLMVIFDDTGVSNVKYPDSLKENINVYESYFGYSVKCRLWQYRLKLLYLLLQTGLGKWLFSLKKKAGLENV